MSDQDALVDAQLSQKVRQVAAHGLVGQPGVMWAAAVVTGVNRQHLTGPKELLQQTTAEIQDAYRILKKN